MGMLNYAAIISLDGYLAESSSEVSWTSDNEELQATHLKRLANTTTQILGRRTYGLLQSWNHAAYVAPNPAPAQKIAQRWQSIDKVVVSSSLAVSHLKAPQTRLARELRLADIRRFVGATQGIVELLGATTAAEAIRACVVDQFEFFIIPTVLGRGRKALPDGSYRALRLDESKTFDNGTVYLRYVS